MKLNKLKPTSIEEVRELLNDLASKIPDFSNTPMEYSAKLSYLPVYYLITGTLWNRVEWYGCKKKNMDNATYLEWKKVLREVEDMMFELGNFMREVISVYIEDEASLGAK